MNLKKKCETLKNAPKKLLAILGLSAVATFNAIYLTINAYSIQTLKVFGAEDATSSFCDINSTFSCSSVFTYDFAWMFGIPFSLIAAFVYPAIIIITLLGIFKVIKNYYQILFFIALGGLLFNSYIIYNEILVSTYCLLCLACTVIIIAIGILAKKGHCDEMKEVKNKSIFKKIKNIFKKK